ncbi:unnamed protein product [Linum tenue]|uniref:Uncharacterized protein n=1 Tax=Linum tenue TaxID=586396 RepID=A0AAV0NA40_9ROSI|nr:unnamed protein product [Linum tenue]
MQGSFEARELGWSTLLRGC